jgi:O-antigen ligase
VTAIALVGRRHGRARNGAAAAAWVGAAGALGVITGVLAGAAPIVPLGLLGICAAVGLYVSAPAAMLMALLLARPALQGVAESISFGGVNVLGFMSAGTLVGGLAFLAWRRPRLPLTVPLLGALFLLWALASLTWSFDRADGISDWLGFAIFFVVFAVAAAVVRTPADFHRLVGVIVASLVIPILVGLLQIATGTRVVKEGYAAIEGTLVHPNAYSMLLLGGLVLTLVAFLEARSGRRRHVLGAILVLGCVCFFMTFARSAWVVFAGVFCVLAVVHYRRLVVAALLVLVVATVAVPQTVGQVAGRFADLSPTSAAYSNNSLTWRMLLWERMLPYAEERPLRGQGLATFLPLTNQEIGVFDYRFQTESGSAAYQEFYPHNDYLWVFTELGVPGLVLWVAILLALAVVGLRARGSPALRPYGIALAALVLGTMVMSATDNVKSSIDLLLILFAVGGALAGLSRCARRRAPPARQPAALPRRPDSEGRRLRPYNPA